MKPLEIIYEDASCIVINKPAGLAVQGGKGVSVSLDGILSQIAALNKAEPQRPLLVHRLDKDTSGLILVAKTTQAAALFSRLFAEKNVIKRYRAICKGRPAMPEGVIRAALEIRGSAKKSETRYRLLSGKGDFSLLELELGTGRMHQIRRHLAMNGNPILGDDKYGDFDLNHRLRKALKLRHLLLHAAQLIIPQTPEGSRLELSAPLPDYFQEFLNSNFKSTISPWRKLFRN